MFLLKCSCGCFFTVKGTNDRWGRDLKCQNCGKTVGWYDSVEMRELESALKESGMTMQMIPDDAKITVAFDT